MNSFPDLVRIKLVAKANVAIGNSNLPPSTSTFGTNQYGFRTRHLEARITERDFESVVVNQCILAIADIFGGYKGQAIFDLREFGFATLTNAVAVEYPPSVTEPCPFPSRWDLKIGIITNRRKRRLF